MVLQVAGEVQSVLTLQPTQVPAMLGVPVSPQTIPVPGSAVQSVPVAAGVKLGASGVPVQAGLVKHSVLDTGRSVALSADVVAVAFAPVQTML